MRSPSRVTGDMVFGRFSRIRQGVSCLLHFAQDNVAASQASVAMGMLGASGNVSYVLPRDAHITGISVFSNAARTASTITVKPTIDGVESTTLSAVLDGTNTTVKSSLQAVNKNKATAGQKIGVKITTPAGWTPTTADIIVTLEVTLD